MRARPVEFRGATFPEYLEWFLSEGPSVPNVTTDGFMSFKNGVGILLHRHGQFQAQLFIMQPNTGLPVHRHPNVDAFEIMVGGEIRLFVDGKPAIPEELQSLERGDKSRWWGRVTPIPAGIVHHVEPSPVPGAFVTVQHWLTGTPTSIHEDWDGVPLEPYETSIGG